MNNFFTYSILQYKHSLVLGETLNVGILFYFQEEERFEFVKGDGYRAKSIYPDFDNSIFNSYIKIIQDKVKKHIDLFTQSSDKKAFAKYIHQFILSEDAAGLIFSEPVVVKNVFPNTQKAIDEYAKLLLPGIITEKASVVKHNETFIIKTFTGYIFEKDKSLENRFKKNQTIKTNHFSIKFDLEWENNTKNYIKPISFDFTDESSIQNKAAVTYSHLVDLADYAKHKNLRFDLLIAKPQNSEFKNQYENALDFIDSVKAPKVLILEEKWSEYSSNTFNYLINKPQ